MALDAQPWIEKHLPVFKQLTFPWEWIVVEGASGNAADTSWCKTQKPRLSEDGTHEYLRSIKDDRVTHIYKKHWACKRQMCNAACTQIQEPGVLLEVDSDELWQPDQLETIVRLFDERPQLGSIMFACRYFVGQKLVLQGEHCYGDHDYEWLRAWRFQPGYNFLSHEPPQLLTCDPGQRMSKEESRKLGLVFDHHAYATEAQCAYKEAWYGYRGLVNQWRALNEYDRFPVPLARFFSHVSGELPNVVRL